MMEIEVFMPHFSLFTFPFYPSLHVAKKAGFSGIEVHLAGKTMAGALRIRGRAQELGLDIHWHQGWSAEEDENKHIWNRVLGTLGQLPSTGYTLAEHIPPTSEPAVVYAERFREIGNNRHWWVQTACHLNVSGKPIVPFDQFPEIAEALDLNIVFDIQHFLEWYYNVEGVATLPTSTSTLLTALRRGWDKLARRTKEIHLTDTNPALGNTMGRNVYFGKGILPLEEFCAMVRESGWSGVVVPEISPLEFRVRGAKAVLEKVYAYFSKQHPGLD